jgi:hypothetical protein
MFCLRRRSATTRFCFDFNDGQTNGVLYASGGCGQIHADGIDGSMNAEIRGKTAASMTRYAAVELEERCSTRYGRWSWSERR